MIILNSKVYLCSYPSWQHILAHQIQLGCCQAQCLQIIKTVGVPRPYKPSTSEVIYDCNINVTTRPCLAIPALLQKSIFFHLVFHLLVQQFMTQFVVIMPIIMLFLKPICVQNSRHQACNV